MYRILHVFSLKVKLLSNIKKSEVKNLESDLVMYDREVLCRDAESNPFLAKFLPHKREKLLFF